MTEVHRIPPPFSGGGHDGGKEGPRSIYPHPCAFPCKEEGFSGTAGLCLATPGRTFTQRVLPEEITRS